MSRVTENLQGVIKQTMDRNNRKLSLSLGMKGKKGQRLLEAGAKAVGEGHLSGAATAKQQPSRGGAGIINSLTSLPTLKLPARTSHWLNPTRSKRINVGSASQHTEQGEGWKVGLKENGEHPSEVRFEPWFV